MPKFALHFGAGNIGRGFIAPVLQENDYEVIFVDVNSELVEKLNNKKKYKINFIGSSKESIEVSNFRALDLNSLDELGPLISEIEIISTSVGPQYLNNVVEIISKINFDKGIDFIAFENKYRASTNAKNESNIQQDYIKFIDVVIDKIVPLQSKNNLDVFVEEYGSIVFDSNQTIPLQQSNIIKQGNYDYEFKKKLWMLNGLHLCLAYYGLSKHFEYIHELYEDNEAKEFVDLISKEILESVFLLDGDEYKLLEKYKDTINNRFANSEIEDQLLRVARNPNLKFSYRERFHEPLDILIENDKSIIGFKKILDIVFEFSFSEVDGFDDFKNEVLNLGRSNLYKNFWMQDKNYNNYLTKLGD